MPRLALEITQTWSLHAWKLCDSAQSGALPAMCSLLILACVSHARILLFIAVAVHKLRACQLVPVAPPPKDTAAAVLRCASRMGGASAARSSRHVARNHTQAAAPVL